MKASLLLFLWLRRLQHEEDKRHREQQEYNPRFISLLDLTGRQCQDQRIIAQPSLPLPEESPWHRLLSRGNDKCLITATGLDNWLFYALHRLFQPYYNQYTPYSNNGRIVPLKKRKVRSGHPRMLSSEAASPWTCSHVQQDFMPGICTLSAVWLNSYSSWFVVEIWKNGSC